MTKKILGDTKERYSFSKLSSFNTCKYGYKLTYIDHVKGIGNCFSSYGSEVHSIMERYAKGEIELWDLSDVFEWEFDAAVPEKFPSLQFCPDMRKLYYEQGVTFLQNFPGYDDCNIMEVEESFDYDIDDWTFTGIIDLVFEDKDGRLIIQDYKSKSSFKSKREQAEYARQLYLYSMHISKKFGRNPDILRFFLFRKNTIVDIKFDPRGVQEALSWARETVRAIRECWDYPPTCESFYGENLCNHREHCVFK